MTSNYGVKNIKEYKGIKGIRKRPNVYIGAVNENGIIHLCKEAIDNSCDEFLAGYAKKITIKVFEKEQTILIQDDGRGIPICDDISKIKKVKEFSGKDNIVEKLCTDLHVGGKFSNDDGYKVSSGLNGLGMKCINALSSYFKITINRDGFKWTQEFKKGKATTNLIKVEKSTTTGTEVEFIPDTEIFSDYKINCDLLEKNSQNRAFLNNNLLIQFYVYESRKSKTEKFVKKFQYKNGLVDYLNVYNKKPLIKPIYITGSENTKKSNPNGTEISFDIAFNYGKEEGEHTLTFVNSIENTEGGTHLKAFRMAISETVKKYIDSNGILNKREKNLVILGEDIRENLYCILSLKHSSPQYDSQTKIRLSNTDVEGPIRRAINSEFSKFLTENPDIAKIICNNVIITAKSRKAAKAAKDKVLKKSSSNFLSLSNVSKLADCINKDNETTELFIVEGKSASGPAKEARDRYTQAIYSIRGKPLNVCDINIMDIVGNGASRENKEIEDIVNIWGGNGIGNKYDDNARKYGKLVILADADSDGIHIQSLLSTLIFKNYKSLIENKRLYIALPPLYRITENGKYIYILDDYEYDHYIFSRMKKILNNKYSIKDLKTIRKTYLSLEKISTRNNIPLIILQDLVKCKDKKEVVDVIKKKHKSLHIIKKDKIYICNGFLDDIYINFIINKKLVKSLEGIKDLYKKHSFGISLLEFESALKKATPKHRTRMKGLGEMNADELKNTTLDPNHRRMIQLELSDFNGTNTVIDNLMSKKRREVRKKISMESSYNINYEDLDI